VRRPETVLHLAVASYLRVALRPPTLWFTLDSGAGRMTPAAAGLLKARGGVRGLPDLMVMHPDGILTAVLGIELKAGKGRASAAQGAMAAQFDLANAHYIFCRSLEEVEGALVTAGIPLFATVGARGSIRRFAA